MALYLLVSALKGEESADNRARRLPGLLRRVLEAEWEGIERYRYAEYMVVTSRGYNLATAGEAALKLMKTTYIRRSGFLRGRPQARPHRHDRPRFSRSRHRPVR
jgi:fructoselysine-6-P-deglycase FrlB-like protein